MQNQRKLLFILGAIVLLGIIFAQKIVGIYVDWLWFETYGFESVLFTMLGAQLSFGLAFGGFFFMITYLALKMAYRKPPLHVLCTFRRKGVGFLNWNTLICFANNDITGDITRTVFTIDPVLDHRPEGALRW